MTPQKQSLVIVAGAGDGLGHALLERFDRGEHHVVGLRRSPSGASPFDIRSVDLADAAAVSACVGELVESFGPPSVVVHNPAALVIKPFAETSPSDFERLWRSTVLSAVHLGQATIPAMLDAGGGSFLVSGATASLRGGARFAAFASAKFALRGLAQSLAREYSKQGIHVAHIILDGIIDTPSSRELHTLDPNKMMKTGDIAKAYWQLVKQPQSTWTHELDLRPHSESF